MDAYKPPFDRLEKPYKVIITNFDDSNSVLIRKASVDVEEALAYTMERVKAYKGPLTPVAYKPFLGTYVLAKYKDMGYARARVLRSDYYSYSKVLYIDTGEYNHTVPTYDLYRLPASLVQFKQYHLCFKLEQVLLIKTTEAVKDIQKQFVGMKCTVSFSKSPLEKPTIDLFDADKNSINYLLNRKYKAIQPENN